MDARPPSLTRSVKHLPASAPECRLHRLHRLPGPLPSLLAAAGSWLEGAAGEEGDRGGREDISRRTVVWTGEVGCGVRWGTQV